ncbi:trypsin-like peptidase domain-containing protein [Streptomyces sp. JB150]|uniref:nSTAND1 domain-containing NTPase n=1 Tax=Streptomyces sp. JB150 TaxID=2714844 RepID=UPI001F108B7E|nr:trypsin-like peptidase domain-containing protein [Streptomyces sp. JB150]
MRAGNTSEALAQAVARVRGTRGQSVGTGFLAADDLVLTCAHVVSDALGLPRGESVAAGAEIRLDFPLTGAQAGPPVRTARVERWIPIRPDRTGDVAVLRLAAPVPGTRPLPMAEPAGVWQHEVGAVGFTGGEPDTTWFRGRLGGPTGEGWIQLSRADGQAAHIRGGFSGSPVWDGELGAVVGLVVAAQREREAQQSYVLHTRTLLRELPELAPVIRPASPFRGLATFRESDADVFFGRDADIEDVLTALRGQRRTVVLYGPSGSGKSSLALAGVAPRMQREGHDVLVVDAGQVASPRTALGTALFEAVRGERFGPRRAGSAAEVETLLAEKGLADTLYVLRGGADGRTLVVLDQAEALLDRTETEVNEAVDLLLTERGPDAATRVLVTLRADFMDAVLRHPRLGPALRGGRTLPLTPMTRDQLAEVITRPLDRVPAVDYDPGLDRRILDDAGGEPGILPMLGFVLRQLWDRRDAGRLRATAYEEMGGVSGALERHAEQAWRECVAGRPDLEAEALRLLTGLVRLLPGSDTPLRRRLTRQEAGETRWQLARAFAERRLLVLHGDEGEPETAELAHEALITAWPVLRRQVQADGEFLAARAELAHDLERWHRADRSPDLLPGPLHLAALQRRLADREPELTPEERDFLALARARQRARRNRVRAGWVAVAVVFALIVGLGTFLLYQRHISEEREAQGRSRALAGFADETAGSNPALGILSAVAAYDVAPTREARNALMRQYEGYQDSLWILSGAQGKIRGVATSNDGRVTLVTTRSGRATLFVRVGRKVLRHQLGLPAVAQVPMVSGDGRRIAYVALGDESDVLYWHDVQADARTPDALLGERHAIEDATFVSASRFIESHENPFGLAALSRDRSRIAAVDGDGRLRVWDLDRPQRTATRLGVSDVRTVRFGPDRNTLVVEREVKGEPAESGSSAVAIDVPTNRMRVLVDRVDQTSGGLAALAVSGDGGVLVTCSDGGLNSIVRAVRVADGREVSRHKTGLFCFQINVNETGSRFATREETDGWIVVTTGPGERRRSMRKALGPATGDTAGMPLFGTASAPVVLAWGQEVVTARPVTTRVVDFDSQPHLLDDDTAVVHLGSHGEQLGLIDMSDTFTRQDGGFEIVAKVDRGVRSEPGTDSLAPIANPSGTLVADQIAPDTVVLRELPSLKKRTTITARRPPEGRPVHFMFLDDDEVLSTSGTHIQQWDAVTGRETAQPIDVPELELTREKEPQVFVRPHPDREHLTINILGDDRLYVIDRHTAEEDKGRGVRFGDDLQYSVLRESGRYALVVTMGNMIEGWSISPDGLARRVIGPLGPVDASDFRLTYQRGGFTVAAGTTVRVVSFTEPDRADSYVFGLEQTFLAMSPDGKTLLRSNTGEAQATWFRLDPGLWKRHLCGILGHDLTEEERRTLPAAVPDQICPA